MPYIKKDQINRYCRYCGKLLDQEDPLYNDYYCSHFHKLVDNRIDYRLFYNKSDYNDIKKVAIDFQLEEVEGYFDNVLEQVFE